jgi:23S rRNA pseudouridine2605 synthase
MDSEGLLLLTDDGELANLLTHPRHSIPKIYHVTVSPSPSNEQIQALSAPMELDGYRLQPVGISVIDATTLEMTLYEGRNRQIRKMCALCELSVKSLTRIAIGKISLGSLPVGKWRHLTPDEIEYLKRESAPKNKSND